MSRLLGAIIGIVLLSAPGVAAAKDELEPKVQAILACESVSPDDARLQCYDRSIPALKQALTRGNMVLREKKGPSSLEGVVKASGRSGENRYWVVFENGDRWQTITKNPRRETPRPGTRLRLKKTLFGNYWLSGPGWPESEADFIGHGS